MQMVGCDKKLLSGKLFDRCLICGGDGSSCVLIKGLYNKNYRVYGKIKMASTVKKGNKHGNNVSLKIQIGFKLTNWFGKYQT